MNKGPEIVEVSNVKPVGWFSRLVWPFITYRRPADEPVVLTLRPAEHTSLILQAVWLELPGMESYSVSTALVKHD